MQHDTETRTDSSAAEDETLDCSGLLCPLPVYKASLALAKLAPGNVLKLICTDPGSLEDIPALARQASHELLAVTEGGGTQTFWLRKGAAQ
jgi:tRNA 2-thiouridine synthesizing protein A